MKKTIERKLRTIILAGIAIFSLSPATLYAATPKESADQAYASLETLYNEAETVYQSVISASSQNDLKKSLDVLTTKYNKALDAESKIESLATGAQDSEEQKYITGILQSSKLVFRKIETMKESAENEKEAMKTAETVSSISKKTAEEVDAARIREGELFQETDETLEELNETKTALEEIKASVNASLENLNAALKEVPAYDIKNPHSQSLLDIAKEEAENAKNCVNGLNSSLDQVGIRIDGLKQDIRLVGYDTILLVGETTSIDKTALLAAGQIKWATEPAEMAEIIEDNGEITIKTNKTGIFTVRGEYNGGYFETERIAVFDILDNEQKMQDLTTDLKIAYAPDKTMLYAEERRIEITGEALTEGTVRWLSEDPGISLKQEQDTAVIKAVRPTNGEQASLGAEITFDGASREAAVKVSVEDISVPMHIQVAGEEVSSLNFLKAEMKEVRVTIDEELSGEKELKVIPGDNGYISLAEPVKEVDNKTFDMRLNANGSEGETSIAITLIHEGVPVGKLSVPVKISTPHVETDLETVYLTTGGEAEVQILINSTEDKILWSDAAGMVSVYRLDDQSIKLRAGSTTGETVIEGKFEGGTEPVVTIQVKIVGLTSSNGGLRRAKGSGKYELELGYYEGTFAQETDLSVNGYAIDPENIEWKSDDPLIADVENGHIKAVSPGETVVTAVYTAETEVVFQITVRINDLDIRISHKDVAVLKGGSMELSPTVSFAGLELPYLDAIEKPNDYDPASNVEKSRTREEQYILDHLLFSVVAAEEELNISEENGRVRIEAPEDIEEESEYTIVIRARYANLSGFPDEVIAETEFNLTVYARTSLQFDDAGSTKEIYLAKTDQPRMIHISNPKAFDLKLRVEKGNDIASVALDGDEVVITPRVNPLAGDVSIEIQDKSREMDPDSLHILVHVIGFEESYADLGTNGYTKTIYLTNDEDLTKRIPIDGLVDISEASGNTKIRWSTETPELVEIIDPETGEFRVKGPGIGSLVANLSITRYLTPGEPDETVDDHYHIPLKIKLAVRDIRGMRLLCPEKLSLTRSSEDRPVYSIVRLATDPICSDISYQVEKITGDSNLKECKNRNIFVFQSSTAHDESEYAVRAVLYQDEEELILDEKKLSVITRDTGSILRSGRAVYAVANYARKSGGYTNTPTLSDIDVAFQGGWRFKDPDTSLSDLLGKQRVSVPVVYQDGEITEEADVNLYPAEIAAVRLESGKDRIYIAPGETTNLKLHTVFNTYGTNKEYYNAYDPLQNGDVEVEVENKSLLIASLDGDKLQLTPIKKGETDIALRCGTIESRIRVVCADRIAMFSKVELGEPAVQTLDGKDKKDAVRFRYSYYIAYTPGTEIPVTMTVENANKVKVRSDNTKIASVSAKQKTGDTFTATAKINGTGYAELTFTADDSLHSSIAIGIHSVGLTAKVNDISLDSGISLTEYKGAGNKLQCSLTGYGYDLRDYEMEIDPTTNSARYFRLEHDDDGFYLLTSNEDPPMNGDYTLNFLLKTRSTVSPRLDLDHFKIEDVHVNLSAVDHNSKEFKIKQHGSYSLNYRNWLDFALLDLSESRCFAGKVMLANEYFEIVGEDGEPVEGYYDLPADKKFYVRVKEEFYRLGILYEAADKKHRDLIFQILPEGYAETSVPIEKRFVVNLECQLPRT